MPKQSKISKPSKPGAARPIEEPSMHQCVRCGRTFSVRRRNFPASQSSLYHGNGGFLPVCRNCVDEVFDHYRDVLGDEKAAMRRVCMKFDIYWNEKVYDSVSKANTSNSRVMSYISKSNLSPHTGKTFDDTLDEDVRFIPAAFVDGNETDIDEDIIPITDEIRDFWGSGLDPSFYAELEKRYHYWCGTSDKSSDDIDISERAVIRQICMLEVTIARDTANGKSIDKSINSLNTLLGSANLKPIQKKEREDLDASLEQQPFGKWIRKIEDTRPIRDPDPEFQDVDHIVKYISVWFLGHLCKMLKIDNKYSRLYEEEMSKLRVDRPEYEGESDESIFEDIFDRASRAEEDKENEAVDDDS